jgi:hypothetical protein
MTLGTGDTQKTISDSTPPKNAEAVTLGAGNVTFSGLRLLYIGTAGNLQVVTSGGQTVTFVGVFGGTFLPVLVTGIVDAGTTATNVVATW